MPLPYQGRIGERDLLSPTLIPNFYMPSASNQHTLDYQSPAQYLQDNPRSAASATVTIAGTVASGDKATVTLTQGQLPSGSVTASYTAVSGDTADTVAEGLASALNAVIRSQLGNALVTAIYATADEAVVTIEWDGPMGNFAGLTTGTSGSMTVTASASTLSGGSGPVFCANNFNYQYNGSSLVFYYGKQYALGAGLLKLFAAADMPVV